MKTRLGKNRSWKQVKAYMEKKLLQEPKRVYFREKSKQPGSGDPVATPVIILGYKESEDV